MGLGLLRGTSLELKKKKRPMCFTRVLGAVFVDYVKNSNRTHNFEQKSQVHRLVKNNVTNNHIQTWISLARQRPKTVDYLLVRTGVGEWMFVIITM